MALVVLLTNGLSAFNLVRVYRQVFLDVPHPKTRRAPEVNWLMAMPMLSLAVIVLLVPVIFLRLDPVPGLAAVSRSSLLLVLLSGCIGALAGALVPLDKFWSRSVLKPLRALQDLLAYDFYTDKIYRSTIVAFVAALARAIDRFDRLVLNQIVNRFGSVSMASSENLKLAVSGQLQSYVLTVLVAIVMLLTGLVWLQG
jgi:NAD(P)H-quinone oxidoreductase subunit 5